jgi:F-type H+-transporting ATPase subunit beta
MNTGSITAIRGIVVDMKFEGELPKIYDAVEVQSENASDQKVVIEVLQQLDGGQVR